MTDAPDYGKPDDILEEAKEVFKACEERESENRQNALDDIKFALLDEQWPEAIRRQRQLDGRPCLTINRLRPLINQVRNSIRQNRPSIKVHPVDDEADPETAEIYGGLIRNIEVTSKADVAYDTAAEAAIAGGVGYFRIATKYACDDTFDVDLAFEAIPNPFSVYGDPYSTASDSADWDMAFETELISRKAFEAKYKGAEPVDWESDGYDSLAAPWREGDDVLVARYWKREKAKRTIVMLSNGVVMPEDEYKAQKPLFDAMGLQVVGSRDVDSHKVVQTLMTGAEVIEPPRPWLGRYIPIVPVYGDVVNVEGKRHLRSLIRGSKDSQLNFNYWRTATTELVALAPKAPFVGPKGAFLTDKQKWSEANNVSHPYIEYDGPVAPQRQAFAGPPAGAMQEALSAADDIKATSGIFNEAMGQQSNAISGKAILARQREGDVQTFHFTDNLARAVEHGGRILVDLIPQVYTQDRIIRVMGQDGKPQTVRLGQQPDPNAPQQPQQAPPGQGQPPKQDDSPFNLSRFYDLGVGKYDLTVETGPSYTTQRQEAADSMGEFIHSFPQAAPVIGDLYAKAQDWPDADVIAKRLETMLPPQIKGQNPEVQAITQQAHQAIGQATQHAQAVTQQAQQIISQKDQEIQQLQQQLAAKGADIQVKSDKNRIDAYNADTKRIEATAKVRQAQLEAAATVGVLPGAFDPAQGQVNGAPGGEGY